MRKLKITEFGNPVLRAKTKKVSLKTLNTKSFKDLCKNMLHTMRDENGVGLAAPQIGKPISMFVAEFNKQTFIVINPKIVNYSKKQKSDWEGCLSLGNVRALVPRSESIIVEFHDEKGEKCSIVVKDFLARIFQHEIDHLNGILFLDRVVDTKSIMSLSEFKKRILKKKNAKK